MRVLGLLTFTFDTANRFYFKLTLNIELNDTARQIKDLTYGIAYIRHGSFKGPLIGVGDRRISILRNDHVQVQYVDIMSISK